MRPISKRTKAGYLQVGVETYGGGIWHSWLDRDLSLAGRVVVADKKGNFTAKLVKIDRPLLRIPTLAIHCTSAPVSYWDVTLKPKLDFPVDRNVNDNFKFNQETEFIPILGLIANQLNTTPEDSLSDDKAKDVAREKRAGQAASSIQENHHPALLSLLSNELSVAPEEIHDFEMCVYSR